MINDINISSTLKQLRKASGLVARDVREKLSEFGIEISEKTLYGYESGLSMPNADTFVALCRIYNCDNPMDIFGRSEVSPDELTLIKKYRSLDGHGKEATDYIIGHELARIVQIKQEIERVEEEQNNIIYLAFDEQKASAGIGYMLDDERMEKIAVLCNDLTCRADFCVCIDGNSMEPMYHDGDIVLVRQQPAVDVGEIGLYIKDGKGYIKCQGDGMIESLNPEYEDIAPTEFEDIICKGKVLGRLKSEWIR